MRWTLNLENDNGDNECLWWYWNPWPTYLWKVPFHQWQDETRKCGIKWVDMGILTNFKNYKRLTLRQRFKTLALWSWSISYLTHINNNYWIIIIIHLIPNSNLTNIIQLFNNYSFDTKCSRHISNTRKSVSAHIQTLRSGWKNYGAAEFFF